MNLLLIEPTQLSQYEPLFSQIDFGNKSQFILSCTKYVGLLEMDTIFTNSTLPSYDKEEFKKSWEQRIVYNKDDKFISPLMPIGVTGWYTWKINDEHFLWLGWFGVCEKFQRKGIGKQILDETIYEIIKDFDQEYLYVFTDSLEAESFYIKYGFEKLGVSRDIYGENNLVTYEDSDIILRLKIK